MEQALTVVQLLSIYTFSFSSVGLIILGLVPALEERVESYIKTGAAKAGRQFENMFVDIPAARIGLVYMFAPIVGGAVGWFVVGIPLGLAGGVALGFVVPRIVVTILHRRRQRRFQGQLVDALMIMSSSLKAGLSLLQSLEVLAEEMPPPCSQEFGLVIKEMKMGMAMDEALSRLLKRMPSHDLQLVVTAMLVARETGGDVTEVFSRLIETIRERQKIKEKVQTLTTMPRLQGIIMALLPVAFSLIVYSFDPHFFDVFVRDPIGHMAAIIIACCWVVSLFFIWLFSRPPVM